MPEIVEVERRVVEVRLRRGQRGLGRRDRCLVGIDLAGRRAGRLRRSTSRSSAAVSWAWAAVELVGRGGGVDRGQDLAGRDRLARLDVDSVDRARDGEVQSRPGWPARSSPNWPPSVGWCRWSRWHVTVVTVSPVDGRRARGQPERQADGAGDQDNGPRRRWASGSGARPMAARAPGRSRRRAAIPLSDPLGSPAPRPIPFSPWGQFRLVTSQSAEFQL